MHVLYLELRDYFAGHVAIGYLAAYANEGVTMIPDVEYVANYAYKVADALIAERAKAENGS